MSFLMLIGLIAAASVFARMFLALPAAALGQRLLFGPLWHATRSNGFRLVAAGLLVLLPFAIIESALLSGAAGAVEGDAPARVGVATDIALALVLPLERILLTIMLSLEYDVLFRGGGPQRQ